MTITLSTGERLSLDTIIEQQAIEQEAARHDQAEEERRLIEACLGTA